jgi:hypothetical protein
MKKKNLLIIGAVVLFAYILKMLSKRNERASHGIPDDQLDQYPLGALRTSNPSLTPKMKGCNNPSFNESMQYSGRECSGQVINENKTLKLGDQGCEVLLLQQRLNALQTQINILKPTGKFCCKTRAKLISVMGVDTYALNQFNQDEQIGFNELKGGTKVMPYSYMDLNTYR